ncbi:MAG: metallophosphoesterase [Planctomycetota bacterium]
MTPAPTPLPRKVFETVVHELALGDEEVRLVSDLHLHPERGAALAVLDALLAGLPDGAVLVVLGDLFDHWVGDRQASLPGWSGIVDRFAAVAPRLGALLFLRGNRDFMLGEGFARRTGGRVLPGGLCLRRREGPALLCLHGDELCRNDLRYQRTKRRLRSAPVRALLRVLPMAWAMRAAERARARSRDVVAAADQESLWPLRTALAEARGVGPADLVFGHIHRCGAGALPGAGEALRYAVLPAFDEHDPGHARWRADGSLELLYDSEVRPWPGDVPLS